MLLWTSSFSRIISSPTSLLRPYWYRPHSSIGIFGSSNSPSKTHGYQTKPSLLTSYYIMSIALDYLLQTTFQSHEFYRKVEKHKTVYSISIVLIVYTSGILQLPPICLLFLLNGIQKLKQTLHINKPIKTTGSVPFGKNRTLGHARSPTSSHFDYIAFGISITPEPAAGLQVPPKWSARQGQHG